MELSFYGGSFTGPSLRKEFWTKMARGMFAGSFGNLITKLEETVYPQLLKSTFKILFLWCNLND